MKYIIGLLAMLLPILAGAQRPPIKAFTIGDMVPDITLNHLINYKTSIIKISSFRGKLLILDFWAIWCSGCIHEFSKLDSLQKQFGTNLQILLINEEGEKSSTENQKKVKAFFVLQQKKHSGSFSLPSTLKRTEILDQLFPHVFIPHFVWIAPDQKIIAITSGEEITRKNIEAVLKGAPLKMAAKTDTFPSHHQN